MKKAWIVGALVALTVASAAVVFQGCGTNEPAMSIIDLSGSQE